MLSITHINKFNKLYFRKDTKIYRNWLRAIKIYMYIKLMCIYVYINSFFKLLVISCFPSRTLRSIGVAVSFIKYLVSCIEKNWIAFYFIPYIILFYMRTRLSIYLNRSIKFARVHDTLYLNKNSKRPPKKMCKHKAWHSTEVSIL